MSKKMKPYGRDTTGLKGWWMQTKDYFYSTELYKVEKKRLKKTVKAAERRANNVRL